MCRFGFPKTLQATTTAVFSHDEQGQRVKLEVQPATNDPLLNKFNRCCLSTWRANMDISVAFEMTDVARYIAKYTSKAEKATTDYTKIFEQLVTQDLAPDANLQRMASALLLKTVGNMDVCAQQAAHVVCGLPLYKCSRHIVMCYVDGEVIQDELHARELSDIRKYLKRPVEHENCSFVEMMKLFTMREAHGTIKCGQRKGEAVLRILPKYSRDPLSPQYSKYCMQFLILHKPFRQWQDLTDSFSDASEAYVRLKDNTEHLYDFQELVEDVMQSSESDDVAHLSHGETTDAWMTFLDAETPLELPAEQLAAPIHNWVEAAAEHQHLVRAARSFLVEAKQEMENQRRLLPVVDHNQLNAEQRRVYEDITEHFRSVSHQPLRALVLGTAGTGKSFLIHCMKQVLGDQCAVLAPTGVAALNINGQTIHSFQFAKVSQVNELKGASLQNLQDKCEPLKYIIIDELSMVSNKLLYAIDQRLRQAMPTHKDKFFGLCSIVMFGDLGQLPPVGDCRMFVQNSANERTLHGFTAYRQFNKIYYLQQSVRQADDHAFRDLLLRLRDGETTLDDYELLSQRFQGVVSQGVSSFHNAVRLFPTHEKVDEHNSNKLIQLCQPVASIEASHNCIKAKQADSNTACGLQRFLSLAEGCRIMLRANLWVDRGLLTVQSDK